MTKRFNGTTPTKEKTVKQQVEDCIRFVNFYESDGVLAPSKPYKSVVQAENVAEKYSENLVAVAVEVNYSTIFNTLGA